ncbi:hypothetical protein ACFC6U_30255 [Kitasatospora purpeofusca]|uniref:hypothetical protein n=1 Tax=Kitasatospora purpeofusca TaxID=67352 RepID=UPI0035DB7654
MNAEDGPQSSAVKSLIEEFSRISRILDESQSTLAIDPMLERIASTAEATGGIEGLESAILWMLRSGQEYAACEIIQFYGYRFRWPRLRVAIEEMLRTSTESIDLRAARSYELMLEAFDDNWEDREFFPSLEA